MTINEAVPPARPLWKDSTCWFALALVFISSSVFNILPTTFPIFQSRFGWTLEQMGRAQFMFFISWIAFSLFGGQLTQNLGLRRAAVFACLFTAGCLTGIGAANTFGMDLAGAFCFGLGIAWISVVFNAVISDHFGERRQTMFFLSGILDAGGAMVGPVIIGWWFTRTGPPWKEDWRAAYFAVAAAIALFAVWAGRVRARSFTASSDAAPASSGASATLAVLRSPAIYIISLLGFFHSVTQAGGISFIGQLYVRRMHIDPAEAAYFLSVKAAGFLIGRSCLSWITSRWKIPELLVLAACAGLGAVALSATILAPSYLAGLILFGISGLMLSGNGPSINSYLGSRFVGYSASAFALFAGISSLGGAAGSYLVGGLGSYFGVEFGIWFVPVFSVILAAASLMWFMVERRADGKAH